MDIYSLPGSRFLECHTTFFLGERCVTSQKTAARETTMDTDDTEERVLTADLRTF